MKKLIPLLGVVATLGLTGLAMACPSCKDSVPNSDAANPGGIGPAFNNSVYLLLGTFLAMVGLVSHLSVKAVRSVDATKNRKVGPQGFPMQTKDDK